jgi:hypothetical protein
MHHSYGSPCAKVGTIPNLLQNWEFIAVKTREDWANNDDSMAECRRFVTLWKRWFRMA